MSYIVEYRYAAFRFIAVQSLSNRRLSPLKSAIPAIILSGAIPIVCAIAKQTRDVLRLECADHWRYYGNDSLRGES